MICAVCARTIDRQTEPHDGLHDEGCPRLEGNFEANCWCNEAPCHPGCCDVCRAGVGHVPLAPLPPKPTATGVPFVWAGGPGSGQEWRKHAACLGADVDLFFPVGKGASSATAKRICLRCPVRQACLDDAIVNNEEGVRGGMTEYQRRSLGQRGGLPIVVCGTDRGWSRHVKSGEEPCAICRAAHAVNVPPYGAFPS